MEQLKIFGCLLVIVAAIATLHGETITYINDVEIYINSTYWKCDMIECPAEAQSCRVTKQKLQPDDTHVRRVNTCYYGNETILLQSIYYDWIGATESISLNVISYRTGGFNYIASSSSSIVGSGLTTGIN